MRMKSFFVLLICLVISTPVLAAGGVLPGSGTNSDPYLIEDVNDFDTFAADPNYWAAGVHTKLMTDIDLSGRTYTTAVIAPDTNPNYGFEGTPFSGIFDGNEFVIQNLTINTSGVGNDYLGLFGKIEGITTEVKYLAIDTMIIISGDGSEYIGSLCGWSQGNIANCNSSISIHGGDYTYYLGGLCGMNYGGAIINCHTIGNIIGGGDKSFSFGGLCGKSFIGDITNCYAVVEVTGNATLGGLCGENQYGTIMSCYATGEIIGDGSLGGLCGFNDHGTISSCHALGNISGDGWRLGGLCGYSETSEISNCYAVGLIIGANNSEKLGGLCGEMSGTLENCYSTGFVTSGDNSKNIGGLCGRFVGTINNCYSTGFIMSGINSETLGGLLGYLYSGTLNNCFWDVETSEIGSAGDNNYGAIGKTTTQMQTQSTFTGWDFATPVWRMLRPGEDYPRLAWQETFMGDIAGLYGVDLTDFAEIARNWQNAGCPANCEDADINGSGDVGIGDLVIVTEDWLNGL